MLSEADEGDAAPECQSWLGVSVERRQGHGVQEWPDGSRYEGEFVNGLKHGRGRYTWSDGESYEGSFYKDYRHGDGEYDWPTGHKFIGKFYLNRKEGYGRQLFPNGTKFQGLYHTDQRFGPGVICYPDGSQDVGLWLGNHLFKLCTSIEDGFSLKDFPEFASYMDPAGAPEISSEPSVVPCGFQTKNRTDLELDFDGKCLPIDEEFIYPTGLEYYSTDGDHLPLPPGRRNELNQHFYGKLWEPDMQLYQGYERDPISKLPLPTRMMAHIHNHKLQAGTVDWDVAAVLSLNRARFGPKGILEASSEQLIQLSARGDRQAVAQLLLKGLVYPDVADSRGHTALIAATVNCHDDVIHLLLDMGVDIDKLNCEGMSALAVCHVLYYPFQSLNTRLVRQAGKTQQSVKCQPACGNDPQISLLDTNHSDSDRSIEELTEGLSQSIKLSSDLGVEQGAENQGSPRQTFDSFCSISSDNMQVIEEVIRRSAGALGDMRIPKHSDIWETLRKFRKNTSCDRASTLKLLLDRGADPNSSRVPMPVLFLAIMAADAEAVRKLLLCGARTDISLPAERKGLYPLHVAAALPGTAGPKITELLLHAVTDPDAQACDQDEIYEPDKGKEALSTNETPNLSEGGRTALHVACQRECDHLNASKVVALLLAHGARTDLLWSGHSPLSLAIASGNDKAVEELLKRGADPNLSLGRRVGSALCALSNINYQLGSNRAKLLDMLAKAGADILKPVLVGDFEGTAVDYAHYSFNQDTRIADTPFHALNMTERETFSARHELLNMMGDQLRQTASQREKLGSEEYRLSMSEGAVSSKDPSASLESLEKPCTPALKFCYHCGRSVGVTLMACSRCHKVLYCSRTCQLKGWDERHREECVRVSASTSGLQKRAVFKNQRMSEEVIESDVHLKENYSCN